MEAYTLPAVGRITWSAQGRPWAIFSVEDVIYNVDVQEYIQLGPKWRPKAPATRPKPAVPAIG